MKYLILFFCLLVKLSFAQEKAHIAIIDLSGIGIQNQEAQILTNKLRSELIKTNQFIVLDRGEMDVILEEQGFQQSGCTSSECAVEVGQILGVRYIVAGTVGYMGDIYYSEIKLIDIETSKIVKSADDHASGNISNVLLHSLPKMAKVLAGLKDQTSPTGNEIKNTPDPIVSSPTKEPSYADNSLNTPQQKYEFEAIRSLGGDYYVNGIKCRNKRQLCKHLDPLNPATIDIKHYSRKVAAGTALTALYISIYVGLPILITNSIRRTQAINRYNSAVARKYKVNNIFIF